MVGRSIQYEQLSTWILPLISWIELVAKRRGDTLWPYIRSLAHYRYIIPRVILSHLFSLISKNDMG